MLNLFCLAVFLVPFLILSPFHAYISYIPSAFIFIFIIDLSFVYLVKDWMTGVRRLKFDFMLFMPLIIFIVINLLSLWFNWNLIPSKGILSDAVGFKSPFIYNIRLMGHLIFSIFLFWLTINVVDSTKTILKIIKVAIISSVLAALYGIYMVVGYMLGLNTGQHFIGAHTWEQFTNPSFMAWKCPRLYSVAMDPADFSDFLLFSLIPASTLFLGGAFNVLVYILMLWLALFMSFSLGGWFAALIGLICLILLLAINKLLKINQFISFVAIFALIMGIVLAINYFIYPNYIEGFSSITKKIILRTDRYDKIKGEEINLNKVDASLFSKMERGWQAQIAFSIFKSHPLFGVGIGNYGFLYNQYKTKYMMQRNLISVPNNTYLEILAESGIVGFATFLWFIGMLLFHAIRFLVKSINKEEKVIMIGLLSALIAFLAHALSMDIFYHSFSCGYVWILMGLIVSLRNLNDNVK